MKKIIFPIFLTLILSACLQYKSTPISNLINLGGNNNDSINLSFDNIPSFRPAIKGQQNNPTKINMTISGTAANDSSCITSLSKQGIDGTDIPLSINETNFTTYSQEWTTQFQNYNGIILLISGNSCNGKTLNVNINFNIGKNSYEGFKTFNL